MVRQLNNRKKILFSLILCLAGYVFLELGAFAIYSIAEGRVFSLSGMQDERSSISGASTSLAQGGTMDWWGKFHEVIHPYLGFVRDPSKMEGHNQFGFPGLTPPLSKKQNGQLVVGIFGGSFAEDFSIHGRQALIEELNKHPAYQGREMVFHTIAMGGYKQPQQLMSLSYLLSLGAHFDIVINLDGFNDITLAPVDNLPQQVFYSFPRAWMVRVHSFNSPELISLVGEISLLEKRRQDRAGMFSIPLLHYSVIANIVWKKLDGMFSLELGERRMALQQHQVRNERHPGYLATGPANRFNNEAQAYQALAELWSRSSLQMSRLCEANGIAYFHFLQPNQYLQGSKQLSADELEHAYAENQPYKPSVEKGYPLLISEGERLFRQGVSFHDLTMIFSDTAETVYRDSCCHLLHDRYRDIGKAIADSITQRQSRGS